MLYYLHSEILTLSKKHTYFETEGVTDMSVVRLFPNGGGSRLGPAWNRSIFIHLYITRHSLISTSKKTTDGNPNRALMFSICSIPFFYTRRISLPPKRKNVKFPNGDHLIAQATRQRRMLLAVTCKNCDQLAQKDMSTTNK